MDERIRIELACCEQSLLAEINEKVFTRDDVALTYAMTLCSSERDSVDWGKVNKAIIDRWSFSALNYIKEKAWKMAEGKIPMSGNKRTAKLLADAGVN